MMRDETTETRATAPRRSRRGHAAAIVALMALVLTGCGESNTDGDDEASTPATTTPAAAETTGSPEVTAPEDAPTTTATPQEPDQSVDVSEATVTVGDETYAFGSTGFITERCNPDFFGGAQVLLQLLDVGGEPLMVDDQLVFLNVALIPNDPSSTAVTVPTPEPDREWIADTESLQVSGTSVDDWSIEGNRITGAATFSSTAGEGPVPGTFEILCAEE